MRCLISEKSRESADSNVEPYRSEPATQPREIAPEANVIYISRHEPTNSVCWWWKAFDATPEAEG
jgi:hypothetical protein